MQFSSENKIDLPFPTTSEFKLGKKVEEEKEEEEDKNSDTSRNKTDINRQGSSSPKRISSSPVSPFLYFSAVGLKAARVLAACTSHGPFLSIRTIYSRNNCVMQKNAVRGGSRRRIALKHVARASVEQPPSSASFLPSTPPLSSPREITSLAHPSNANFRENCDGFHRPSTWPFVSFVDPSDFSSSLSEDFGVAGCTPSCNNGVVFARWKGIRENKIRREVFPLPSLSSWFLAFILV